MRERELIEGNKMKTLPRSVATVVGEILGNYYFSHRQIETLFYECGALGDPPSGSCEQKITHWLIQEANLGTEHAYELLGKILEEFMDGDLLRNYVNSEERKSAGRERIRKILTKHDLEYATGGKIYGVDLSTPSKSLDSLLRDLQIPEVEAEFNRALTQISTDPPAAVTAACAILEAFCKLYITEEQIQKPSKQDLEHLWKTVSKHLGIAPNANFGQDINKILSGLVSIIDGIACFRTHEGSAHGSGKKAYKIGVRHARLAVHAAHTLTLFAFETRAERRGKKSQI